jgi:hypothetical protein
VEQAVEAAARCGLLRRETRPPYRLSFRDALIQRVLLAQLSSSDRTRLREGAGRPVLLWPIQLRDGGRPARPRPPAAVAPGDPSTHPA